jgi:hypothetical protein
MTYQIVFVECEIIESLRKYASMVHEISLDKNTEQLYSPRLKHFPKVSIKIKNSQVLYIHHYQHIMACKFPSNMEFMCACRSNSSNKNTFLLKTTEEIERTPFLDLIKDNESYIPVSGNKLPDTLTIKVEMRPYILQMCHILSLWKERGLLESKKSIMNVNGVMMEVELSTGGHKFLSRNDGWIMNVSTPIIAMLIDYYEIDGELPNAQLNFSNDAEYRFRVAKYLLLVLKAFCINNSVTSVPLDTTEQIITQTIRTVTI